MRLKLGWVLLACVLFAVAPTLAVDRVVNTATGENTGDCAAAACKTIQYAVRMAASGDVIRVFPGTYTECVNAAVAWCSNSQTTPCTIDDDCALGPCNTLVGLCTGDTSIACTSDEDCVGTCDGTKALSFVANAIEAATPDRTVTVVDGTGVCGGRVCLLDHATSCLLDGECAGLATCDIPEGETEGTCSSDEEKTCTEDSQCETCLYPEPDDLGPCNTEPGTCAGDETIECTQDSDCVVEATEGACFNAPETACVEDGDCENPCIPIGYCSTATDTLCGRDSDCPEGEVCNQVEILPAIQLGPNSSLKGFTVKGGGQSGVWTSGTFTIEQNLITRNTSPEGGGGIYGQIVSYGEDEVSAVPDPARCWGDLSLTCTSGEDCQVCEGDHELTCTSAETCAAADAGECVDLGSCIDVLEAKIDDNIITENLAGQGGGIDLVVVGLYGGGARAIITSNTITGNGAASSYGGGVYTYNYAYGYGRVETQVSGNTVSGNAAEQFGGGISTGVYSFYQGASRVAITTNTVEGNYAGVDGGGISGAVGYFGYSYGYGDDVLDVTGNTVEANEAGRDGGGIAVQLVRSQSYNVLPKARIGSNEVLGNTAARNGGGIDLYVASLYAYDYPTPAVNGILADKNTVGGNAAGEFGGGINSALQGEASFSVGVLRVEQNTIHANTAGVGGGGASLATDSNFVIGTNSLKAKQQGLFPSEHWFANNFVVDNDVRNEDGNGVGGGAFVLLTAGQSGIATVEVSFSTFKSNLADLGGGAVEVEADTGYEGGGVALLDVINSIGYNNVGYALGGPVPGQFGTVVEENSGNLVIGGFYNDAYGNTFGNIERTLVDAVDTMVGSIEDDPMLDDTGVPDICSPTIDGGDPDSPFENEPMLNGFRANMGHLGNTADAVQTLPDVNGDRQVSGADNVLVSNAAGAYKRCSNSETGSCFDDADCESPGICQLMDDRYLPTLDLNRDGFVDGDELAYVAAFYGRDCR